MDLTQEQIEALHNAGLMPDWCYYQVNGKSAIENYISQTQRSPEEVKKKWIQKQAEKKIEQQIEKETEEFISKTFDELMKDFGKK